jgi:hypothetical protein
VDAHSAMVMAQGFTQDQVQSILENIDGSSLIDDKTKVMLHFAEIITRNSYKIHEGTLQNLREQGCTDEELFETIAVAALFNFMDRMADALWSSCRGFPGNDKTDARNIIISNTRNNRDKWRSIPCYKHPTRGMPLDHPVLASRWHA